MNEAIQEQDWITQLRAECGRSSQRLVSLKLGVSPAVVNQVLLGRYPASTRNLEARVRGLFMREVVTCPVLGEISTKRCQDEQRRERTTANPYKLRLYYECRRGCPHSTQPQLPKPPEPDWDAIERELYK